MNIRIMYSKSSYGIVKGRNIWKDVEFCSCSVLSGNLLQGKAHFGPSSSGAHSDFFLVITFKCERYKSSFVVPLIFWHLVSVMCLSRCKSRWEYYFYLILHLILKESIFYINCMFIIYTKKSLGWF